MWALARARARFTKLSFSTIGAGGTRSTIAPSLRRRLDFSIAWSEGRQLSSYQLLVYNGVHSSHAYIWARYPLARAKVASDMPVDPEVPSYIVSPEYGVRIPSSSACAASVRSRNFCHSDYHTNSIMLNATRSLEL